MTKPLVYKKNQKTDKITLVLVLDYGGFTLKRDIVTKNYLICLNNYVYAKNFCSNYDPSIVLKEFISWVNAEGYRIAKEMCEKYGEKVILDNYWKTKG